MNEELREILKEELYRYKAERETETNYVKRKNYKIKARGIITDMQDRLMKYEGDGRLEELR